MNVYVAGASAELERAKAAMNALRGDPEGRFTITHDWTVDIERERIQGGRDDADLTLYEQRSYASAALHAVNESDIFWLLVPQSGVHTSGAWVELGTALLGGRMRLVLGLERRTVICSGPTSRHYLFASLCEQRFELDSEAFEWLTGHVRSLADEPPRQRED